MSKPCGVTNCPRPAVVSWFFGRNFTRVNMCAEHWVEQALRRRERTARFEAHRQRLDRAWTTRARDKGEQ